MAKTARALSPSRQAASRLLLGSIAATRQRLPVAHRASARWIVGVRVSGPMRRVVVAADDQVADGDAVSTRAGDGGLVRSMRVVWMRWLRASAISVVSQNSSASLPAAVSAA